MCNRDGSWVGTARRKSIKTHELTAMGVTLTMETLGLEGSWSMSDIRVLVVLFVLIVLVVFCS